MPELVRTTITLPSEALDQARRVAADFGLVSASGPRTGEGNVSALLSAIARGDLVVSIPGPGDDGQDLAHMLERFSQFTEQLRRALEQASAD